MILISNIGNRDLFFNNKPLDQKIIREESEKYLNNYDNIKNQLTYPLIIPFFEKIKEKYDRVYLFVTNQESVKERVSDTIYFGEIIKKWIQETYKIKVNVISYSDNPTDYERIYNFFTAFFTQKNSEFEATHKRIIALSGGTPQMNGALYVILSSLFPKNNEFYSVYNEKLIPVNHERTINKIFVKKSCIELLKNYQYQSIITLLEENNILGREQLILLLNYAKLRKNFDFDEARKIFHIFLNCLPSSMHKYYEIFHLKERITSLDLINELYWNIEICYKNQNYLILIALLFRLEEALLFEINNYLFKDYFSNDTVIGDLNDKKFHFEFLKHLEKEENQLWSGLQNLTYKGRSIKIEQKEINRPILFFIALLKLRQIKKEKNEYIYQIGYILDFLDQINKYCHPYLSKEQRLKKYKDAKSMKCLGDLRNSSIIAHGFDPISKDKIEKLYSEEIEIFMNYLKKHLKNLINLLNDQEKKEISNMFEKLNNKLISLILEL